MDREEIIELIRTYAKKISDIAPFYEILLYGSWARGTAKENSDIDIAVFVSEDPDDLIETEAKLWDRCREVDLRLEPLLIVDKDDPSGFKDMVKKTGIRVYP
ncbi:MAG: nucleotidyltransferase domain-containing protein [Spirochaetota bacterium]|nr:nucleotidyltransferase domain-containing protein [Spirochaetota bacterium]